MRPKQPDPVPEMKRAVAAAIVAKIEVWSQEKAAALLRTNQPRVSNLRRTRLDHFSLEQLVRMATYVNGYAYIEIRFRQDQIGPANSTRAPAGQPPDARRLTWVAADEHRAEPTSSPQDSSSEPRQALPRRSDPGAEA